MKKFFILLFSLLIACGPSEKEIQAQINEAVEEALQEVSSTSTSTTSTSTSTTSTSSTTTSTSTSTTSTTTTIYVDSEPPTWPDKTITIVNMNPTYFEVLWKPANDNTNVAGYRFYLNNIFKGEYLRNNDNNTIFLDGLSGGTTYILEIIAYDDESNQSIDNPILSITTTTPTTTTTTLPAYGKMERVAAAAFVDCSGNGCKLVLLCNSGDHIASSPGARREEGPGGDPGAFMSQSETLFQKGEYSGMPLESGALFEFNSITQEEYNQHSEEWWGFVDVEVTCQP